MKNKVEELTIDNQYLANINLSLGTQQTAMQERINILENKLRQAEGQQHEESSSELIDLLSSDDEEGDDSAMSTKVAAQEKRELTTKKEVNESDKSSSSSTAALSADIGSQNDNDKVHDEHQTKKKGTVVDTDALSDISNKTTTPKKKSTNKAQEKGVTSVNEAEVNASLSLKETTSTKSSSPTTALPNIGNSQNSTSSASKASSPSATMNSTMNSNTDSLSSPIASCKRSTNTNTNTTTTPKKSCEEYKDSEVHEDGSALGDSHLNSPQLSSESFETEQGQGTKRKRRRPVMFSPNLQSAQKRKSNTEGLERKERSNTGNQAGETINVGDVGYKFKKYFPSYRDWYDGEVVEILRGERYSRRCKYTDGDIEDYTLAEMRDTRKFKPRD